ncbi:hypothetical protein [Hazenella coriacea]|uniref:Uncharacterized protein n=1 Tax=Hazenella coriacea TaxID=1179467 RepID=A0A4R3L5Z1_9BACL|nr:hypothetical protein [Hazenella coriacea]TCS94822.1 hypothetical protein EDD58_103244 [Hazenella coriacea]
MKREKNLESLVGQFVVVRTRLRTFIGCLVQVTPKRIVLRIWNGRSFVLIRIPRITIKEVFRFPCGPLGARFVVVKLKNGISLVGCQIITAPSRTILLTVFVRGRFVTIRIRKSAIRSIIPFPCP